MNRKYRQLILLPLLAVPLIFLASIAVRQTRAARPQAPPVPAGFPVPILKEVPKDYLPQFNQGFTVVQIGQSRRDTGGLVYAATTTTLHKSSGASLTVAESRSGDLSITWTDPNGTAFNWGKGDSAIRRSFATPQQHTAQELLAAYARAQKIGGTFALYRGVLCHTSYDTFEKTLVAPELNNMFLWVERKKYLLETVSLSRGEPDQAQWDALMAKVPAGLPVVDEQ